MKHNLNKILPSSLLAYAALLVLFAVHLFVVHEVWSTNEQNLRLQYQTTANDALANWEQTNDVAVLDTIFTYLDQYTYLVKRNAILQEESGSLGLDSLLTRYKKTSDVLFSKTNYMQQLVEAHFKELGLPSTIQDSLIIQRFELKLNKTQSLAVGEANTSSMKSSSLVVRSFSRETSDYLIEINYIIDLKNYRSILIEKTILSFLLSLISFVFILSIFLKTHANLAKERKLSDMKTDFINNMTHELKTPLSTISVSTSMLKMEEVRKDPHRILEKVTLIDRQNKHLNELINKLLDISMWEKEEFTLDKQQVSSSDFFEEIHTSFRERCCDKVQLLYENNIHSKRTMEADPMYLRIAINNLLNNAQKYSQESASIKMSVFETNGFVCVKIKDNGTGIAQEDQEFIFSKFYRVNQQNIHKVKGLGLGLFYTKKIVESHGGNISVKSARGKGSTFTMKLSV